MRIGSSLVALCLAVAARGQDFLGHAYNVEVGAASRGALGTGAGETMTRLDGDEAAGWGAGVAGARTIASIACIVQDLDAATPETFDVRLYPEDPARPGFPDLTGGVPFQLGVPGPTGVGGLAALVVVTPPAPVSVPIRGGGDVFVSFGLPAATATDGLSMQVVLGYNPGTFTRWDTPSLLQGASPPPAASPANSHFVSRVGALLTYAQRRQHWLDVAHATAGGGGLAITNQPNCPGSHAAPVTPFGPAPGVGDFLSGSFPDVRGDNAGRADDVAMRYVRQGLGTGRVVAFLLDQDFTPAWGGEVPVASVFGGATGVTCLVNPQVFAFQLSTNSEAWNVIQIPAALRPQLTGITLKQQAVGIDAAGVFHAGACDAMRM